ncbi:hypothetical protein D9611_011794 [Ephemerocybe angulata]|uniref:HAT C-terminal dimerisation domain-containing protein n=1 Tax=Ephemerocybe angulata TaxID=980116 RepID=A0A8H5C7A4_9AGAR|nr:hypothetical protein D9611_011794 [Tulosesus angulatus]
MSESPPPVKSRVGRIITATKRKLSAPTSTFLKAVKKPRTSADPKPEKSKPSKKAKTGAVAPKTKITGPRPVARQAKKAIVIDSEDDEDLDDMSSNGEVLDANSDHIMEEVQSDGEVAEVTVEEIDDEVELVYVAEKKKKTFKKGVYGFFKDPVIEYIDGRLTHKFDCIRGSACGRPTKFIRRFQDTGDATSTGNMRDHVKKCFSLEALTAADDLTANGVREVSYKNGGELTADAITVAFQRKGGKGRVTYSTRAHTKAESRPAAPITMSHPPARALIREEYDENYAPILVAAEFAEVQRVTQAKPEETHGQVNGEGNMFDVLPALAATDASTSTELPEFKDELDHYLSEDVDRSVVDAIPWWHKHRKMYPRLSRMALDYLTIPATSVDVERVFSRGRLIITHLRNRLTAQSIRALLCMNYWSLAGLVRDSDVLKVVRSNPEVEGDEDVDLEPGWDHINLD